MDMNPIFEQIAKQHGVTVAAVRRDIEAAFEDGMENESPIVKARWAKIPKKGKKPTTEEIFEYLINKVAN